MKPTKTDIIKFITVMIVFLIGMIIMLMNRIESTWIWIAYIALWTFAEKQIAGKVQLKDWQWILIIIGILGIDFLILYVVMG